eukprot:CAMPEP_0172302578 /NCGR_PEP_ID=MMETSP1058-20130122/4259_1 /TAXON_ID=83371 /ORGANISM="Detonula confervacea, Strain CCMP 353" /LENGTH=62 /DNA_ID=CAMNT_0013013105 /DNA_START=5 /DNA_END=190 /DNA_ORIENTATION=+
MSPPPPPPPPRQSPRMKSWMTLVVLLMNVGTAISQAPIAGVFYMGVGEPLDDSATPGINSYT